jgi:hypothetical protein
MMCIENLQLRERERERERELFLSQSITKHTNDKLPARSPFSFILNHCTASRAPRHAFMSHIRHIRMKVTKWRFNEKLFQCGIVDGFEHEMLFIALNASIYVQEICFTLKLRKENQEKAIFFDCESKTINSKEKLNE